MVNSNDKTFGVSDSFDRKPSEKEVEEAIKGLDIRAKEFMEENGLDASNFTRNLIKHDGEIYNGVLTLPWTVALRFNEVKGNG